MASEADVLVRKKDMSDKISTQVRTLGVGILALTWGLAISDSAIAREMTTKLKTPLLWVGTLAIGVILLDFLQYVCAYEVARRLLNRMEAEKLADGQYDYESPFMDCTIRALLRKANRAGVCGILSHLRVRLFLLAAR